MIGVIRPLDRPEDCHRAACRQGFSSLHLSWDYDLVDVLGFVVKSGATLEQKTLAPQSTPQHRRRKPTLNEDLCGRDSVQNVQKRALHGYLTLDSASKSEARLSAGVCVVSLYLALSLSCACSLSSPLFSYEPLIRAVVSPPLFSL